MAGFLTIALAVPTAFAGAGLAFGIGYFVVNAVHTGLFWYSGGPRAARAVAGIAPYNLASALRAAVVAFAIVPLGRLSAVARLTGLPVRRCRPASS